MHALAKNRTQTWYWGGSIVILLAYSSGCPVVDSGLMVPDFMLEDVNSTSSTFGRPVSPRHYLQQVSGWYFGHAT